MVVGLPDRRGRIAVEAHGAEAAVGHVGQIAQVLIAVGVVDAVDRRRLRCVHIRVCLRVADEAERVGGRGAAAAARQLLGYELKHLLILFRVHVVLAPQRVAQLVERLLLKVADDAQACFELRVRLIGGAVLVLVDVVVCVEAVGREMRRTSIVGARCQTRCVGLNSKFNIKSKPKSFCVKEPKRFSGKHQNIVLTRSKDNFGSSYKYS